MDDDTKVLVRDLDLTITGPPSSTTYWPWTLDGSDPSAEAVQTRRNSVDNVEQVQVDAPPVGCYTVRVSHTGGTFTQPYALLITGASLDVTPPVITCPPDINQTADAGKCSATIDVGTATATDNCGVDTIVGDPQRRS